MKGDLVVDQPAGERWDLGLELLRSGEAQLRCGSVGFRRWLVGPDADGQIHISFNTLSPDSSRREAEGVVRQGLDELDALRSASSELDGLLTECGCQIDYVFDYDNGAVSLGKVVDGELIWDRD